MPSSYDGAHGGSQPPAPSPSPGVAPRVALPSGSDPRNAASIYQPHKVEADFIDYVQKSARLFPQVAAPSTGTGFSAVTTGGGATGVVTPNNAFLPWSSDTTSGLTFVIKCTLAGAVGVAKYQWSSDGGATFNGSDLTTAAAVTHAGVLMTMTGTFSLNEFHAFRQIDTPRIQLTDHAGNLRGVLADHCGYPTGSNLDVLREQWSAFFSVTATGLVAANPSWLVDSSQGTVSAAISTILATGLGPISGAGVTPGNNLNDNVYMTFVPTLSASNTPTSSMMVVRWGVYLPATVANQRFFSGLIRSSLNVIFQSHTALDTEYIAIYKIHSLANWQCECRAAGVSTSFDSGVVATANAVHAFRLEVAGSTSQFGANIVRFFINGKLVGAVNANIPGTQMRFQFGSIMTAAATGQTFRVSQIDIVRNPAGAAALAL